MVFFCFHDEITFTVVRGVIFQNESIFDEYFVNICWIKQHVLWKLIACKMTCWNGVDTFSPNCLRIYAYTFIYAYYMYIVYKYIAIELVAFFYLLQKCSLYTIYTASTVCVYMLYYSVKWIKWVKFLRKSRPAVAKG